MYSRPIRSEPARALGSRPQAAIRLAPDSHDPENDGRRHDQATQRQDVAGEAHGWWRCTGCHDIVALLAAGNDRNDQVLLLDDQVEYGGKHVQSDQYVDQVDPEVMQAGHALDPGLTRG